MEERCCLCGTENCKPIVNSENDMKVYVCDNCTVEAVSEIYWTRRKKSRLSTRLNWGFWLLIAMFVLFLLGKFVFHLPQLGG